MIVGGHFLAYLPTWHAPPSMSWLQTPFFLSGLMQRLIGMWPLPWFFLSPHEMPQTYGKPLTPRTSGHALLDGHGLISLQERWTGGGSSVLIETLNFLGMTSWFLIVIFWRSHQQYLYNGFPRPKLSVRFENLCDNFQMGGSVQIHLIAIRFTLLFVCFGEETAGSLIWSCDIWVILSSYRSLSPSHSTFFCVLSPSPSFLYFALM